MTDLQRKRVGGYERRQNVNLNNLIGHILHEEKRKEKEEMCSNIIHKMCFESGDTREELQSGHFMVDLVRTFMIQNI